MGPQRDWESLLNGSGPSIISDVASCNLDSGLPRWLQAVKNLPAMQETWVRSLGWEEPLENGKATHSSILTWRIPWTEWSMESQRIRHDWVTFTHFTQFSSVAQSCPTLCNSMNCSTPGLPVHHQLPEFTQTHVHRVSDAIQPSHPLSPPSPPAPNPSQHHSIFQWVKSWHEVAKVLDVRE